MVYVPEGIFTMGSTKYDPDVYDYEKPQHAVYLDAFWIDRTPVTNAEYARFVRDTGREPPDDPNDRFWMRWRRQQLELEGVYPLHEGLGVRQLQRRVGYAVEYPTQQAGCIVHQVRHRFAGRQMRRVQLVDESLHGAAYFGHRMHLCHMRAAAQGMEGTCHLLRKFAVGTTRSAIRHEPGQRGQMITALGLEDLEQGGIDTEAQPRRLGL